MPSARATTARRGLSRRAGPTRRRGRGIRVQRGRLAMADEGEDATWDAVEAAARADLLRRNCRTCRWCERVPETDGHWSCVVEDPHARAAAAPYRDATRDMRQAAHDSWPPDEEWPQPPCLAWDDAPRWKATVTWEAGNDGGGRARTLYKGKP